VNENRDCLFREIHCEKEKKHLRTSEAVLSSWQIEAFRGQHNLKFGNAIISQDQIVPVNSNIPTPSNAYHQHSDLWISSQTLDGRSNDGAYPWSNKYIEYTSCSGWM
jgi:hypothetical protein